MTKENNSIPSYLKNDTLKGEIATLTKYGYDVFFSSDKYNTKLDNTVNKSHTGRASFYSSPWEITGIAGSNKELSLESKTKSQLLQANTLYLNVKPNDWIYAEHEISGSPTTVTLLVKLNTLSKGQFKVIQ